MRLGTTFFLLAFGANLYAQPQIGGGTCSTATLSGIYYYILSGDLFSGTLVYPYAELGKLTADGKGNVSGGSHSSVGGLIASHTLAGTYSIQSNCSGTMQLSIDSGQTGALAIQIINGGQSVIVASMQSGVFTGRAYRQTSGAGSIQCGAASLSGGYGFLFTGVGFLNGSAYYLSEAGSLTADGMGNVSSNASVNTNGTIFSIPGQGTYSVATDCSGSASIKGPSGTSNLYIAVADDGGVVLFMDSDANYAVAGVAQPQFVAPQSAVVNAASFDAHGLSPGAIFSVFGQNMPQSVSAAQVIVNGQTAPVFFANGAQINAQMPTNIATSQPVTLTVSSGGSTSRPTLLALHPAAPGIFSFAPNRAVVQNSDYSINTSANPAHPGDTVIAYMTGGGAVTPSVATGTKAPAVPLSGVNAPSSFTIGGAPANSSFFGLTPGFIGLYQANIQVPSLPAGDYAIVATVGGISSNSPVISVAP